MQRDHYQVKLRTLDIQPVVVCDDNDTLQTKQLVRLSQQELMDCSWGEGNNACDGGEDFRAYQWIMKHGLASEDDYGPYLGAVRIHRLSMHIL